jgi:hypothetical protein
MNEIIKNKVEKELTPEEEISLSKKVSFLMTKPENTDTEAPLLLILKNNGFNVKKFKTVIYESTLVGLYPDMKNWNELVQQATKDHMLGQEVEIFLVTSDEDIERNVTEELLKLRGLERESENNPSGTLRKELGGKKIEYSDDSGKKIEYFENGFHCPRDANELIDNLKAFGLLDEARSLVG